MKKTQKSDEVSYSLFYFYDNENYTEQKIVFDYLCSYFLS
jgi:hypothetical protein